MGGCGITDVRIAVKLVSRLLSVTHPFLGAVLDGVDIKYSNPEEEDGGSETVFLVLDSKEYKNAIDRNLDLVSLEISEKLGRKVVLETECKEN